MITSIKIKNFKSHVSSELSFIPGLTCIVGTSGHGKTNVFRALRWVFDNRPLGDSIRKEKDGTEVVVGIDGHEIRKIRVKGKNTYYLDKEKFEAIGKEVPEEIRGLINFGELNTQSQLSPHFLVLDPPGKVAEWLNRATGLGNVEGWIDGLSSKLREAKRNEKETRVVIEELKGRLDGVEFSHLNECGELIDRHDECKERIDGLKAEISCISDILASCDAVGIELKSFDMVEKQKEILDRAECLSGSCIELEDDMDRLGAILDGIEDCDLMIGREGGLLKEHKEKRKVLYGEMKNCPVCKSPLDDNKRKLVVERLA